MRIGTVIIFLLYSIVAQCQVKFYTKTNARQIVAGSDLEVEFILENANGRNFTPPKFDGFDVVRGPSSNSRTSIVNGKMSKSMSYSYTLIATKMGSFTIAPAKIIANNKSLKSQPVMIKVLKGSDKKASGAAQAFVQIELSDSTAYIGQQVLLDYRLYTTLDIRNYNLSSEPKFDGFFVQNIRNVPQNKGIEIINGVQYQTQVLRRYALFPQQTGTYEIEGTRVTLGVATANSRNRGFFFSSQTKPMYVNAKGTKILVDNVSINRPSDFSGAIGKYNVSFKTGKRAVTTDETVVINLTVSGDGDDKMVLAPNWEVDENLTMYDPNIIEERSSVQQGKIVHTKRFEYLITSDKVGSYELKPSMSYYDVDSNDFVTLDGGKLTIAFLKGEPKNDYTEEVDTSEDVFKMIATQTSFRKKEGGFYSSLLHKLLLGIIGLSIGGLLLYKQRLNKSGNLDPAFIRKQQAASVFKEDLNSAQEHINSNDAKSYFAKASMAFKSYLNDKFEIDAVHMKKEEILSSLKEQNFENSIIEKTQDVLQKSEQVLYAPMTVSDMQANQNLLFKMLDELEAFANVTLEEDI